MNLIDQIESGRAVRPRRVLLYGTRGIGLSSFAAALPSPIFTSVPGMALPSTSHFTVMARSVRPLRLSQKPPLLPSVTRFESPGVIETDMSSFAKSDDGKAFTLSLQSLKRVAQPDDIAQAYVFLASDDSRWVTGEIIEASGGTKL